MSLKKNSNNTRHICPTCGREALGAEENAEIVTVSCSCSGTLKFTGSAYYGLLNWHEAEPEFSEEFSEELGIIMSSEKDGEGVIIDLEYVNEFINRARETREDLKSGKIPSVKGFL